MPKPLDRPTSRYARDASLLLGQTIRLARIDRRMTTEELAQRAGLSRGLVGRIERGEIGCSIGAVFEAAAVVGVRLFDADQSALTSQLAANKATLTLLPQAVRTANRPVKDDF